MPENRHWLPIAEAKIVDKLPKLAVIILKILGYKAFIIDTVDVYLFSLTDVQRTKP